MEVLAIIPAREGSKGIPKKNIQKVNGVSLLEYTVRAAKKSKKITRLIISTDSHEIAKLATRLNVEVPFLRPKKFAKSSSSTIDFLNHALGFLKKKENYCPDIIIILQVTSPLRNHSSIDKSVQLLIKHKASSVLGVSEIRQHPLLAFSLDKEKNLKPNQKNFKKFYQRQMFPSFYYPSGSIYTFWYKTLQTYGNFYGPKIKPLLLPKEECVDVDSVYELFISEMMVKHWNRYKTKFLKKGIKI